jgi:hypothetical protein
MLQEVLLLHAVGGHPHVVQLLGLCVEGWVCDGRRVVWVAIGQKHSLTALFSCRRGVEVQASMVLEYAPHGDLRQQLHARAELPVAEQVAVLTQVRRTVAGWPG